MSAAPRPYVLAEANYRQLLDAPPNVAVLPWGATEAHNYHLPYGADFLQASAMAIEAARQAHERGARPIVLPALPFGNNAQQLDQVATIHCSTLTASAILNDVCRSLKRQGIDRLVIVNGHGGNNFTGLVRDAQLDHGLLIVVADFWRLAIDDERRLFSDDGDHANEMETSLHLFLNPQWVVMEQAGDGARTPYQIAALQRPGPWTPRPWRHVHPDTGSGDPRAATADKGREYFEIVCQRLGELLYDLSKAERGDLPYV